MGLGMLGCAGVEVPPGGVRPPPDPATVAPIPVVQPPEVALLLVSAPAPDLRTLVGSEAYDKWDAEFKSKFTSAKQSDVEQSIVSLLVDDPDAYLKRNFLLPEDESFFEAAATHLTKETAGTDSVILVDGGVNKKFVVKKKVSVDRRLVTDRGFFVDSDLLVVKSLDEDEKLRDEAVMHIPKKTRYYTVSVFHDRTKTNDRLERTVKASFMEELPLVRLSLPLKKAEAEEVQYYDTNVGRVLLNPSLASEGMRHGETVGEGGQCFKRDHWYGSVEELANDWSDAGLTGVTRVDLVTTGRIRGARFAAIGFYLGYKDNETIPSFYVIEAGDAINSVRQVYYGNGFATGTPKDPAGPGVAKGKSTYNPTLLSDPQNNYMSWLSGDTVEGATPGEWDPKWLKITAAHPAAHPTASAPTPYITVNATFTRDSKWESGPVTGKIKRRLSGRALLCRSGGRVRKIGAAMGDSDALSGWDEFQLSLGCGDTGEMVKLERAAPRTPRHVPIPKNPGLCLR